MDPQMMPPSDAADMIVTGLWLHPGELGKLHRRLKRNRTKTSKACAHCRKNKHGCDEQRPCSRCAKKGLACFGEEDVEAALVPLKRNGSIERPMRHQRTLVLSERGNPFLRQRTFALPSHVSQIHWMMGHHEEQLLQELAGTPEVLVPIAKAAMAAVKVLMSPRKPEPPAGAVSLLSERMRKQPDRDINKTLKTAEGTSALVMWMDKGALVREGVGVDDSGMVTGIHPEEAAARVANHDIPIPICQVDGFCQIMDDLLNGMDPVVVRYVKWKPNFMRANPRVHEDGYGDAGANFVKLTRYNVCEDAENDIWHMKQEMKIVSRDEYDQARLATPGICRPLTHLLGDTRSAYELELDREQLNTWRGYTSTEEGVQRLHMFREALEKRFAPLISMAEAITGVSIQELVGPLEPESDGTLRLCAPPPRPASRASSSTSLSSAGSSIPPGPAAFSNAACPDSLSPSATSPQAPPAYSPSVRCPSPAAPLPAPPEPGY